MTTNKQRQRGAALIIVLWTALLLSMSLATAIATARIEAQITASSWARFSEKQAAMDGLDYAAWRIAAEEAGSLDRLNTFAFSMNGYDVRFTRSIEIEKLDINLASERTLAGFFTALGREQDEATAIAARIADWRDPDDLFRPNGAEARDYARARNGEQIGNRPFYSLDELALVLGMPEMLIECAAPALTLFGNGGAPSTALLSELYGANMEADADASGARLGTASRSAAPGQRYAITAEAVRAENQSARPFRLTGVFRITGRRDRPYAWIVQFVEPKSATKPMPCLRDAQSTGALTLDASID